MAESGRTNYDIDGDGLLEINDLSDLNEIRNNHDGIAVLYNSESLGCPSGCKGYELTTDLDFDTNQDNILNYKDEYWNNRKGWEPIETFNNLTFEGNGFTIKNLMIDRASESNVGLIGTAEYSFIYNLHVGGKYSSVVGSSNVGGLVGELDITTLEGSSFTGSVSGMYAIGGLAGGAPESFIRNSYAAGHIVGDQKAGGLVGYQGVFGSISTSFFTGNVVGRIDVGGLVGYANASGATVSFATGSVSGQKNVGGLMGNSAYGSELRNSFAINVVRGSENVGGLVGAVAPGIGPITYKSYWAVDVSGQQYTAESNQVVGNGTFDTPNGGGLLSEMLCPRAATSYNCSWSMNFYEGWEDNVDGEGNPFWDFGDSQQAPGLWINGKIYRDSDGDGILDDQDSLPLDTDNDTHQNDSDQFPLSPSPFYY